MKIDLIALDLDGTTLNRESRLTERTREAMKKAIERGIHVVIATGRCYDALPGEVMDFSGINYAITSNGAQIRNIKTGETLYNNCIDAHAIDAVADTLEGYDYMTEIFVDGSAYIDEKWYNDVLAGRVVHRNRDYVLKTRRPQGGLFDFMRKNSRYIENVNIFFDTMKEKADMQEVLEALKDVTLTSSFDNNWELGGATTSKGDAVEVLCGKLGISEKYVMACGDSPNDGEMLKVAGIPVAVENAKQVIKDLAIHVVPSNNEDGVAVAIEKFVLDSEGDSRL